MNKQIRKKTLQLIGLFAVATSVYVYSRVRFVGGRHLVSHTIVFAISLFVLAFIVSTFHSIKNLYIKIARYLYAVLLITYCSLITSIRAISYVDKLVSGSLLKSFVLFVLLGGVMLFYFFIANLFYKILSEEQVIPEAMKGYLQKNSKWLVLLFGVPVVIYGALDILIGGLSQYILMSPLIPSTSFLSELPSDFFELPVKHMILKIIPIILRTLAFAVTLCLWVYPIFFFAIVKKNSLKILFCLLEIINAAWFTLWTWASIYGWGYKLPPRLSLVVEESIRYYVFWGIVCFYVGFAIIFFITINTETKSLSKAIKRTYKLLESRMYSKKHIGD